MASEIGCSLRKLVLLHLQRLIVTFRGDLKGEEQSQYKNSAREEQGGRSLVARRRRHARGRSRGHRHRGNGGYWRACRLIWRTRGVWGARRGWGADWSGGIERSRNRLRRNVDARRHDADVEQRLSALVEYPDGGTTSNWAK